MGAIAENLGTQAVLGNQPHDTEGKWLFEPRICIYKYVQSCCYDSMTIRAKLFHVSSYPATNKLVFSGEKQYIHLTNQSTQTSQS